MYTHKLVYTCVCIKEIPSLLSCMLCTYIVKTQAKNKLFVICFLLLAVGS